MRDNIKPGGLGDPVAQNIRNEMQADAAPSPEEIERDHQRFLSQGCKECGEDDTDKLHAAMESLKEGPVVLCEECDE